MASGTPSPQRLAHARRTAASSRAVSALAGLVVVLVAPDLHALPVAAVAGFAIMFVTALAERLPRGRGVEETVGALAAVLVVGLDHQHVTVLTLLWLCAVVGGLLGRGGRVHWAGRAILLVALALPVVLTGGVTSGYAAFALGTVSLLLSGGRMTRELSSLLAEARHAADHDALTGMLTGAAFRDALGARLAAGPVGVVLIDLDGFATVKRTDGHAAGDRLLVTVAERLRSATGSEPLLARVGDDEFVVAVGGEEPTALAARLRDALAADVSTSFGVARAPEHGDDADALLRAADVAQRVAKRSGRGQVAAYDGQSLTDHGPTGALGALRRLVAGKGLTMVAQPIHDIVENRIHAHEALARFRTRGTSSPLHWFALAEEYGLRADLELACFRAALELLPDKPAGTSLSVNLSGRLLGDPRVHEALSACGDVSDLIIEVTEDSLVGDDAGVMTAMAALTARGITIAVDDMGAGYSGLRQVTTLRPGYLKLDRSLIRDIDSSPERAALVEAMVGYARRTGSALVAEGVETEAELAAVRALGVSLVQGYLLGRPGPGFAGAPEAAQAVAVACR